MLNQQVTCPLCGQTFRARPSHVGRAHKLPITEFRKRFPDAPLESTATQESRRETCHQKCGHKKGTPFPPQWYEHRPNYKGRKNPFFGKKHSEETRQKMREHHANFKGDKNPFRKWWRSASPQARAGLARKMQAAKKDSKVYKVGDRYDRLVILKFVRDKGTSERFGKRQLVVCRCDCGRVVTMRTSLLKINQTNNCGCRPRGLWQGIGDLSKTYFTHVQRNATIRGLPCQVTHEQLWRLFQKQDGKCALSGLPLSLALHAKDVATASLDRIDNTQGYTLDNVQWVHKDINKAKLDFTQNRFIEICRLVDQEQKIA